MPSLGADWKGRKIIKPEDHDELETLAAIHEFHHNIPRHEAEEKAHNDYKRERLISTAAHHLKGLKAAHAIGDLTIAKKHGMMYKLALNELKHEDHLNPPQSVIDRHENMGEDLHRFRAHPGDLYLIPEEKKNESKDN